MNGRVMDCLTAIGIIRMSCVKQSPLENLGLSGFRPKFLFRGHIFFVNSTRMRANPSVNPSGRFLYVYLAAR